MNIVLCHFRAGETDGVSLEMEKWKLILEKLGHNVFILGGSLGSLSEGSTITELQYTHPVNLKIVKNSYGPIIDYNNEDALSEDISNLAVIIEKKLVDFIHEKKINIIVPNNFWSIGGGFSATIAIYNAIKKTGIECIAHHHDFYWESCRITYRSCQTVIDILDKYFPPENIPNCKLKHVVINKISQNELIEYKNIKSNIVPNVFDFSAPLWKIDNYNSDFRQTLGLKSSDIIVLQATRIVTRKAIELAIEFIKELNSPENIIRLQKNKLYNNETFTVQSRIVYLIAGKVESDSHYLKQLIKLADQCNISMIFTGDIIEHSRCFQGKTKCYSLWDCYANSDFVTYTSIQEGWGNQFLETMFAKLPILIYEYPVFESEIKPYNFNTISLGNTFNTDNNNMVYVNKSIIRQAAVQAVNLLIDKEKRKKITEENFTICKNNFSYDTLHKVLQNIFINTSRDN